jgi:hypothetical protein
MIVLKYAYVFFSVIIFFGVILGYDGENKILEAVSASVVWPFVIVFFAVVVVAIFIRNATE